MPNNNFQPTSRRQRVKTPYETKRVYACGYCSKSFNYSHQLSSHMKNSRVCKSNAQDAISAAASSSVVEDIDQDISMGEFIDIDHEWIVFRKMLHLIRLVPLYSKRLIWTRTAFFIWRKLV
ncbi:hypothetical protein BDB01DRAFT_909823 [Pilobolus umbonatus]|nr:hypothetical protein BDB01DRAFT_909823 [Pilobolus umbonatus]